MSLTIRHFAALRGAGPRIRPGTVVATYIPARGTARSIARHVEGERTRAQVVDAAVRHDPRLAVHRALRDVELPQHSHEGAAAVILETYAGRIWIMRTRGDVTGIGACHTWPVSMPASVHRIRSGLAALRRAVAPSAQLTPWNSAADAMVAFVLAAFTLNDVMNRDRHVLTGPGLMAGPLPRPTRVASCPAQHVYHFAAAQPWQLVLAVLTAAPLALRRRYPIAAFWGVLAFSQIYLFTPGVDPTFTLIACVVAAYSATIYSPYRIAAMVSTLAGAGIIAIFHKYDLPNDRPGLPTLLLLIPIGLAINAVHSWRQRARTLESEKESAMRAAVEEDRARIAQELHDVITHNVSMMVVQAGAARKVMDRDPEKARSALLAVEAGGRSAMTELRHAVGLLTMNGDPSAQDAIELAPQPGLDAVPALVARVRDAGVPIELTTTGTPRPLPPGKNLAGYRVVQEALTNTVKHAVGARVRITVRYAADAVHIDVADTGGVPASSAATGNGRGLIGLRARLAVYLGTLEAGTMPGGGYRVHAVIPMEGP